MRREVCSCRTLPRSDARSACFLDFDGWLPESVGIAYFFQGKSKHGIAYFFKEKVNLANAPYFRFDL
jgi:hypothetical protein